MTNQLRIFPIYHDRDSDDINNLARLLQEKGFDFWLAQSMAIGPDDAKMEQSQKMLRDAPIVVLMLTMHSINDDECNAEFVKAVGLQKPLVILSKLSREGTKNYLEARITKAKKGLKYEILHLKEGKEANAVVVAQAIHRLTQTDSQKSQNKTNPRELYARKLMSQVGYLRLSQVSKDASDRPLRDLYIPTSTNLVFDIYVKNRQIIDWDIRDNSIRLEREEVSLPIKKNYPKLLGERVDLTLLQSFVDDLEANLLKGIDSHYPEPTERPLFLAPPWYDGIKPAFWAVDCEIAASLIDRLVILGGPGSGKSTFLRHLTLSLLKQQVGRSRRQRRTGLDGLTPIFIELRDLVRWSKFPALDELPTYTTFWEYICEVILGNDLVSFKDELWDDLLNGNAIILLDGLDEIPAPVDEVDGIQKRIRQMKELTRSLDALYKNCRIVFSSRQYGYSGWQLEGFTDVNLVPLRAPQMGQLSQKLFTSHGFAPIEASKKTELLMEALREVPSSLKDTPLFMTLLTTIFLSRSSDSLPASKGELYYQSIMLLLDRWVQPRLTEKSFSEQIGCTVEELLIRLENVAFETHKRSVEADDSSADIDFGILLLEVFRAAEGRNVDNILAFLSQQSGVLVSPENERYQFAHRSFQEYLAASYLTRQESFTLTRELITTQPMLWREPGSMIGDIIVRNKAQDKVWEYKSWELIDTLLEEDVLAAMGSEWAVWLAAKLTSDLQLFRQKGSSARRNRFMLKELRNRLKDTLDKPRTLHGIERAEIGHLLGDLIDNRPGVGLSASNDVPDILWCCIPEGKFTIGISREKSKELAKYSWANNWSFKREFPSSDILVPQFHISKFPVTQEQFDLFIQAEGYLNPKWWTKAGWRWKSENAVGLPQPQWGKRRNYPQTNVSWYEAVAYTRWASSILGKNIVLPSELHWERAARGDDGRMFVWGNEFSTALCNIETSGIGHVCPVGCFPVIDGPWGDQTPYDMNGNVWEWCSTICEIDGETNDNPYVYPYKADEREDIEEGDTHMRVLRGGCYLNVPFVASNTFRGRDKPTVRYGRQGFRLVWLS